MIERNTVHCLDCFDLLAQCDDGSVDMILTDAPYNVHEAKWESAIDLDRLWMGFKRVIKPRGAIVMTAQQPFTTDLIISNRPWFKYSWVWVKSSAGDVFNAKLKPMRQHEDVLVFSDGTTANRSERLMPYYPQGLVQFNKTEYRDPNTKYGKNGMMRPRASLTGVKFQEFTNYPTTILNFPNGNTDSKHPNAKPIRLFEYLIATYTREGETVLDCFAGSFTTAAAARNIGRNWICGDSDPGYCEVGRQRLAEPPMFAELPPTQTAFLD
jgi:site-specific DNA-methyltransferase (adenine-specific)